MGAAPTAATPDFGPNVKIITPGMTSAQVKAVFDGLFFWQEGNEFGTPRYAVLFMPGSYGSSAQPMNATVGFYTEVAGLGAQPADVQITGSIDSINRAWVGHALTNFWRSLGNLTINVAGKTGCRAGAEVWAVAQQSPLRRLRVNGALRLHDGCSGFWPLANGAFVADSTVTGTVANGMQQQSVMRDSTIGAFTSPLWDHVFVGVTGAPASSAGGPVSTVPGASGARARPSLYVVDGAWFVNDNGAAMSLDSFYIARPGDSAATLSSHPNVLLTPGVYPISGVAHATGVWLGLGYATLDGGTLQVDGGSVSGVIVDAGPTLTAALVDVEAGELHDVTARVGGAHAGRTTVGILVNGDGALLDDVWAWRADHGTGVGWTVNPGAVGIQVNGDDVTCFGCFTEHFQTDGIQWNGANGRVFFAEHETPFDAPNQAAVYDSCALRITGAGFQGWGVFEDVLLSQAPSAHIARAVAAPADAQLTNTATVSILGQGTIDHIINQLGPATGPWTTPGYLAAYP